MFKLLKNFSTILGVNFVLGFMIILCYYLFFSHFMFGGKERNGKGERKRRIELLILCFKGLFIFPKN